MLPFAIPAALKSWKLIGLGLIVLALVAQTMRLHAEQNRSARYKAERESLQAELTRISTAKDEQAKETTGNIGKARQSDQSAKRVSERIRSAPPTKNCETSPEIMGADL